MLPRFGQLKPHEILEILASKHVKSPGCSMSNSCLRVSVLVLPFLLTGIVGCGGGPTNGRPIAGCPDGSVDVLTVNSDGGIEHRSSSFLAEVQRTDQKLVLVDFWATWCGPCKMLAPRLESIKKEWGDDIEIVKVDVDASGNDQVAGFVGASAIPDVRIFRGGVQVGSFVGLMPTAEINSLLKSLQ